MSLSTKTAFELKEAYATNSCSQRDVLEDMGGALSLEFYDPDGNGAAASILFATLSPNLTTLNNTHFVVT